MRAVLNIVAAVLMAAGLVVVVASLLTAGQGTGQGGLGIDFKLAAILLIGGLLGQAVARALLLLGRMSHDLRQLRKAGMEVPPWLRETAGDASAHAAAQSTAQSADHAVAHAAAALAMAEGTGSASAEALKEYTGEPEEEVGRDIGGEPATAAAARWPEMSEVQRPETAAPEERTESPFIEAPAPASEPEPEPEPQAERTAEPIDEAVADQPAEPTEPEPAEAATGEPIEEPEAEEAATGEEPAEPEPAEAPLDWRSPAPSRLKPSGAPLEATEEPGEVPAEPARSGEDAAEQELAEEPALYVVEERMFRGQQARVLSDGTIEAETPEGWMRFEDFDHLDEYLEAMAEMGR